MITLIWDDEAQREFNCSALYYARREDAALAERFISAVEAAVCEAVNDPLRNRMFRGKARRIRVEHFPFSVIYIFDEGHALVRILAIAHSSRDPGYWRARRTD